MTKQQLENLYYLRREINAMQERIDELERLAGSPSSPNLSGMPRAPHNPADSPMVRMVCEIVDLQAIIAAKQIQLIHEQAMIERWIADIPDSLTRLVFTYRFVHCMSWNKVAQNVGGGNTEDGVRMICNRYVDKHCVRETDVEPF